MSEHRQKLVFATVGGGELLHPQSRQRALAEAMLLNRVRGRRAMPASISMSIS